MTDDPTPPLGAVWCTACGEHAADPKKSTRCPCCHQSAYDGYAMEAIGPPHPDGSTECSTPSDQLPTVSTVTPAATSEA